MAAYNLYRGNGSRAERIDDRHRWQIYFHSGGDDMRKDTVKYGLETQDLLLILILYLMYRESGDKELLIIMGAMYLL